MYMYAIILYSDYCGYCLYTNYLSTDNLGTSISNVVALDYTYLQAYMCSESWCYCRDYCVLLLYILQSQIAVVMSMSLQCNEYLLLLNCSILICVQNEIHLRNKQMFSDIYLFHADKETLM